MANRIAGITVTINGDTTALSKSLESCYRNTCDIYIPPNNHYNQRQCFMALYHNSLIDRLRIKSSECEG